ncbi:MAG: hypothetical protein RL660_2277 [Bacteroidota bacterium]|jgi:PKD repeat protein
MRVGISTILLVLSSFSVKAQLCNYLLYDGFGYTNSTSLHGLSGGTGWLNTWVVQGSNTSVPGYQSANSNALSFSNLQTTGIYANGGLAYLTAGRKLDNTSSGPFASYLTNGNIGNNGSTIYISALLRKEVNNAESVYFSLHNNNVETCDGCASGKVSVGYFGAASDVAGQKKWSLKINNTVYPSSENVVIGATAFFVIQIDFNALSTISLWCNPATLGNVIPAATLVQTTSSSIAFRSLAVYLGNGINQGSFDEMRMATSYACVAPDTSILVNTPPLAIINSSVDSISVGNSISFDGTTSVDANGTITSFLWNFNDGTSTSTDSVLTHTFNALGEFNVTLTVTDNNGIAHTATKKIIVSNANGTYSCLSNVTTLQLPSCNADIGSFRVNNVANKTFALYNATNGIVSGAGNVYSNLAAGNYTLAVAGQNSACRDTFRITLPVDSSTCAGWQPNNCEMQIGTGLEGLSYYASTRALKDYFKSAGEWITYDATNVNTAWNTNDIAVMPADADGYPLSIPFSANGGVRNVRGIVSANGFMPVNKPMRMLYDGNGVIVMNGTVTSVSYAAGRIDFTTTSTPGNIWFNITSSDASNHIRNIRIIELADTATYLTSPFRENFIDKASQFKALRFMDWMHTNNNTTVQWSDRKSPSYYSQAIGNGASYELIVALANTCKKDIWINIPHLANDSFVVNMAQFFKDNLDPGINVYLEYSNEVWNFLFSQTAWVYNNGPKNMSLARVYTDKALHTFALWHQVWGTDKDRVKRVLGTQILNDFVSEEILAHANPNDYDYLSPSYYFGLDHSANGNPNLQALGAAATPVDINTNARNYFLSNYASWKRTYQTAKMLNVKIVNYEGGQHYTDFTVPPYIQAMYDAQIIPSMYNLYQEVLDSLRILDSKLATSFVLCGPRESIYGSWGHLEDIDAQAPYTNVPKFEVLINNINEKPTPIILGASSAASNTLQSYKIAIPTLGSTYDWNVTNGNIVYGQGTDSIVVEWAYGVSGNINCTQTVNTCANTANKTVALTSLPLTINQLKLELICVDNNNIASWQFEDDWRVVSYELLDENNQSLIKIPGVQSQVYKYQTNLNKPFKRAKLKANFSNNEVLYSSLVPAACDNTSNAISLAPNPTKGLVQVLGDCADCRLEVYDLCGKQFYSVQDNQLNLAALSDGYYCVKIFSNGKLLKVEKLMKH